MIHTLSRSLAALVMAIFAGGFASVRVLAEDERPDLKIELVGLPLSGTQREVQVKITNVSVWWSDETRLLVVPSPATAGSPLDRVVENLDPGQSSTFRYTLAVACDGREVRIRAEVSAGKNYEGVPESGDLLRNNVAEGVACPAQAQPAAPQLQEGDPGSFLVFPTFDLPEPQPAPKPGAAPQLRDEAPGSLLEFPTFELPEGQPAQVGASAEDERPDLKVELLGLPLTGTRREVQIEITNVSVWWADKTKLRVETTPPSAGAVLNPDVENLDPGQSATFRYTLAVACDGREVRIRAEVSAGKNYEGVPESGDLLKNNVAEGVACPARSQPPPKP